MMIVPKNQQKLKSTGRLQLLLFIHVEKALDNDVES